MEIADVFAELSVLPRWVPYKLVWSAKREKYDKIPHNGRHGISTADPTQWTPLVDAIELAKRHMISGVGFVMTAGVIAGDWKLMGMDFDGVDFDNFSLPFSTYAEKSPSGTGVRCFAWVPVSWAENLHDALNIPYDSSKHLEIYLGSAPRFLTVTFDVLNPKPIARIDDVEMLDWYKQWLATPEPATPPPLAAPEKLGEAVYLPGFNLTDNERALIEGREGIDRSDTLHGLLIKLIDGGTSQEDALATLSATPALWQYCLDHRHNNSLRALQFAQNEIARAYERSDRKKRDLLVGYNTKWELPEIIAKSARPATPEPNAFPMHLFDNAPGLVGEIAHWILKASYAPREEFAFASALSAVSCLIGPYCTQGSRDGKLNMYLTLVGDTGTGKNEAIDVMALLLSATEARDCIMDFPASEAAMRRQLNVTPNMLLRVDELAHKLESMKNSANGSSLGRAVLEAYNGARMPPKVYADEKKTLPPVDNPFVQILGGTTDKVWDVVKTSHMEDGTLNRFMFVCLPKDPPYRRCLQPDARIDKAFKDRLNAFWRAGKRFDLMGVDSTSDNPIPIGRKVSYGPGVEKAIELLDKEAWEKQQSEYGSLYSRVVQNTLKVAGVFAVGDSRLVITLQDFKAAREFVEWSIANTHYKITQRMADTHFEKIIKKLMQKLIDSQGKLSVRDAYKYMHISRREMEEVTATMVLSGDVEIYADPHSKKEWLVLNEKES